MDLASVARLLAFFEASGCKGAVLAGTTGEGPSLSAIEKRDLIRAATSLRGKLDLLLGVATPSLSEAEWLCKQANAAGARGALLMAPFYFRGAAAVDVRDWFLRVMDVSGCDVIVYNFPQMTGFRMDGEFLASLADHSRFTGVKDSSGERANLDEYRQAVGPHKRLFTGDETLLLDALKAGWNGSISGAANVVPSWLTKVVSAWLKGEEESAAATFAVLEPALEAIRSATQPATNKAVLKAFGTLARSDVRLPLHAAEADDLMAKLREHLGVKSNAPSI